MTVVSNIEEILTKSNDREYRTEKFDCFMHLVEEAYQHYFAAMSDNPELLEEGEHELNRVATSSLRAYATSEHMCIVGIQNLERVARGVERYLQLSPEEIREQAKNEGSLCEEGVTYASYGLPRFGEKQWAEVTVHAEIFYNDKCSLYIAPGQESVDEVIGRILAYTEKNEYAENRHHNVSVLDKRPNFGERPDRNDEELEALAIFEKQGERGVIAIPLLNFASGGNLWSYEDLKGITDELTRAGASFIIANGKGGDNDILAYHVNDQA